MSAETVTHGVVEVFRVDGKLRRAALVAANWVFFHADCPFAAF
jgi:hypothetical protein